MLIFMQINAGQLVGIEKTININIKLKLQIDPR